MGERVARGSAGLVPFSGGHGGGADWLDDEDRGGSCGSNGELLLYLVLLVPIGLVPGVALEYVLVLSVLALVSILLLDLFRSCCAERGVDGGGGVGGADRRFSGYERIPDVLPVAEPVVDVVDSAAPRVAADAIPVAEPLCAILSEGMTIGIVVDPVAPVADPPVGVVLFAEP